MTINEIKEAALTFTAQNKQELSQKIKTLKENGIPFSGCVVFLQYNQQISLSEARKQTLELDIWTREEKDSIHESYLIMMSDFQNENENDL